MASSIQYYRAEIHTVAYLSVDHSFPLPYSMLSVKNRKRGRERDGQRNRDRIYTGIYFFVDKHLGCF